MKAIPVSSSPEPQVITFGCRLNTLESEMIRTHARDAGFDHNSIIINTCAVTGEAERQARQMIRKLKRENPQARIIVTGCSAQMHPETYAAMPQVSHVLGNRDKIQPHTYQEIHKAETDTENLSNASKVRISSLEDLRETAAHLVSGFEGRARAFVEIQNGCDHACTFCIITLARGPNRSVPVAQIVEQVRHWVTQGYHEVVLTGVDITGYGQDLPGKPTLGQMVRRLLRLVPDLKRLRLSSLDPVEIDSDLLEVWATEPRLMPHAHLSLQSGSAMILKRMKRRHTPQDTFRLCEMLRRARPEMVFGADLIAGFPTETEAMFQETLDLVTSCDVTYLHVFPFSSRPGTPAARMPHVAPSVVKERAQRLRDLGAHHLQRFLHAQAHQTQEVLIENEHQGRTSQYALVKFRVPVSLSSGALASVENLEVKQDHWVGSFVASGVLS